MGGKSISLSFRVAYTTYFDSQKYPLYTGALFLRKSYFNIGYLLNEISKNYKSKIIDSRNIKLSEFYFYLDRNDIFSNFRATRVMYPIRWNRKFPPHRIWIRTWLVKENLCHSQHLLKYRKRSYFTEWIHYYYGSTRMKFNPWYKNWIKRYLKSKQRYFLWSEILLHHICMFVKKKKNHRSCQDSNLESSDP